MSRFPTSSRAASPGRLFLALFAPVLLAAIAAVPSPSAGTGHEEEDLRLDPNASFSAIDRLVGRDPNWMVIGRDFHPARANWSLVLWCDSPSRAGRIDRDELLVLEHQRASRSIVATIRICEAAPSAPFETDADFDSAFVRGLRGNLSFRSTVVGRTEQLELLALVDQMLSERVREVEEPDVSLTSSHF